MRKVRFSFKRNPGVWGYAYPEQWRIEVDPSLDDQTLMDITVHEVSHLCVPDLDETAIDRIGKHAADVLWRMGFRREEQE